MYYFPNVNVHSKSHNGQRYVGGGVTQRPKVYNCTKKTVRYTPGWKFQHKTDSAETLVIVRQLMGGQYVVQQTYHGNVLMTIQMSELKLRQEYDRVAVNPKV